VAFEARRVVTGYADAHILEISSDDGVASLGRTPAGEAVPLWAVKGLPTALDQAGNFERPADVHWYLVRVPPDKERGAAFGDYEPGILHEGTTVDLVIVVSGEVFLELDGVEQRVHLKAGDTVVQRGTKHAWHNPTDTTAVLSCVILSGVRTQGTPSRLTAHDHDFARN
jgi:hypothetical protein